MISGYVSDSDELPPREIVVDVLDCKTLSAKNRKQTSGSVHVRYTSRALEWLSLQSLFTDTLLHDPAALEIFDSVTFGWSDPSLLSRLYRP